MKDKIVVELTADEVDYIDKKLTMSRFTLDDHYVTERILEKLGLIELVKLERRKK